MKQLLYFTTISVDERQTDDNKSRILVVYLDQKFTFEIVSYNYVQFSQ